MTSFRLDSYSKGKLISSEMVDGIDNEDLAIKLLLADCSTGHCKLYRDDVAIAEVVDGLWSLTGPRPLAARTELAKRMPRHFIPKTRTLTPAAA
jgi:hypothetical protein